MGYYGHKADAGLKCFEITVDNIPKIFKMLDPIIASAKNSAYCTAVKGLRKVLVFNCIATEM